MGLYGFTVIGIHIYMLRMCIYIYDIYSIDTCLSCVVYIIYRNNPTKQEPPEENQHNRDYSRRFRGRAKDA